MSVTTARIRPRRSTLRAALLLLTTLVWSTATTAGAADYNPERIISNDNMRAANSMSQSEIQKFLETLPGPLATLVAKDHTGVRRPASEIIWRACRAWQISPKVILTMLQKEQSLLTRTTLAEHTLERAMGAGCPNAYTNRYPGFGNQIWNGARLLDSYGESSTVVPKYYYGIPRTDIYRSPKVTIPMRNIATYKLFCYNPSIGASAPYGDLSSQAGKTTGNANFWLIYRRYFGSTFADPTMRPVWAFRNRYNGNYYYTGSIAQRHKLRTARYSSKWKYVGRVFTWDSSVPSTQTVPVYAFRSKLSGKYSYTASRTTYTDRRSTIGARTWDYKGVAFRVARRSSAGSAKLYLLRNRSTGARFFTSSATFRDRLRTNRLTWEYLGVKYYLPRTPEVSTPPTVTPEPTSTVEPTSTP